MHARAALIATQQNFFYVGGPNGPSSGNVKTRAEMLAGVTHTYQGALIWTRIYPIGDQDVVTLTADATAFASATTLHVIASSVGTVSGSGWASANLSTATRDSPDFTLVQADPIVNADVSGLFSGWMTNAFAMRAAAAAEFTNPY